MGPLTAISQAVARSFTFKGRASRSEYWWFILFYTVVIMACGVFDTVMIIELIQEQGELAALELGVLDFASTYAWVATLPAFLSVTVRRLHDAGFSGFWLILYFIPVGALVLLVMHVFPSEEQTSVHGTPASGPVADRTGKPVTVDSHKRAMQGYALLFDKDKKLSPEVQAARKAEVSDYYRTQVLKASKPA
ncbi:DUF805 domain-containing protein [uncultured Sulfitobacter sp.]|uniref:DUF805 domain-containing protein n=1 Tax=uncultured Sulfitobacter sp. TaxID=191468 RepID=UPI00262803E9|nr:DUF805 domain-containing protein [uncultured Sulfitobacter sp.]